MAKVIVLGEDDDNGWWSRDKKNKHGSHTNRKDPGKHKRDNSCKKCNFGNWYLVRGTLTERRDCKRKCGSFEERPHDCQQSRCLLHRDNWTEDEG